MEGDQKPDESAQAEKEVVQPERKDESANANASQNVGDAAEASENSEASKATESNEIAEASKDNELTVENDAMESEEIEEESKKVHESPVADQGPVKDATGTEEVSVDDKKADEPVVIDKEHQDAMETEDVKEDNKEVEAVEENVTKDSDVVMDETQVDSQKEGKDDSKDEVNENEEKKEIEEKESKNETEKEQPSNEDLKEDDESNKDEVMIDCEITEEDSKRLEEEINMEACKEVTGIIFQFNEDTILFEFSVDKEDSIGEISPQNLVLHSTGEPIPKGTKVDDMANFVQAGDEIKCSVKKEDNLPIFSYVEEEEEISEDGQVKQSTRTVDIQPYWRALTGKTLTSDHTERQNLKDEDVLVLEDQLENMFDYEPEEEEKTAEDEDDDDILLIEEVKIDDDQVEKKKETAAARKRNAEEQKRNVKPATIPETPKDLSKEPKKPQEPKEEVYVQQAKLVQLRKPKDENQGKVTTCILEILDGKHAGKLVNAVSMTMYMWGYNLAKANLSSTLKYGDTCTLEYMVQPKKEEFNFDELLVAKKTHFGPKVEKPIRPGNDKAFSVFLANRGIDETGFLKWVYGQGPMKPYLPFVSDIYEADIKEFVRDSTNEMVFGVLLENVQRKLKVNNDGGLVKVDQEGVAENTGDEEMQAEPAPPGMEIGDEIAQTADNDFATKERVPPENVADWTPLHHLQNCVMTGTEFIINEGKVCIKEKNLEFPFDEVTNFQPASQAKSEGVWSSNAPFYTIGTLAFFVKSQGLKFSAYVKRTIALEHKQYVKKTDQQALIDHLKAAKKMAPFNVRRSTEIKDENTEFFNDRDEITSDCSYVVPSFDEEKIDAVFAQDKDFYIGGVSIGKCDLRLFFKIGDRVNIQIQDMSSAEKRKLKKQMGNSNANIEHMASLVYVASEKRPKSAAMTAQMSPELSTFLSKSGWSVKEFDALKTFGLRPPADIEGKDLSDLVEQSDHAQVGMALNLAKRVMKISSPDDPAVADLMNSDDDIKIASFMSKIMTKSLVNMMQANMKAKIQDHFSTPQFCNDLMTQMSKISAAETALKKDSNAKPKRVPIKAPEPSSTEKKENLPEKLKKVEEELKKEAEEKKNEALKKSKSKSKAPARDARKLLDSYKQAKQDINEGLPKMLDEWTPLEYLRHFASKMKKITSDDRYVYFGRVQFLKTTKTNFCAEYGGRDEDPWFTLGELYLAYQHRAYKHSKYLERLKELNKKQCSMHHRDRDAFLKYISASNSVAPSNVKRKTRKELNPEQFIEISPTSNKSNQFSLESLQREEQHNLKARMQLHLLEQQQIQAQQQQYQQPPPQPPPKKMSRFDQVSHPSQKTQPGVIIPVAVQRPLVQAATVPPSRPIISVQSQVQPLVRPQQPVRTQEPNWPRSRSPLGYGRSPELAPPPHQRYRSPERMPMQIARSPERINYQRPRSPERMNYSRSPERMNYLRPRSPGSLGYQRSRSPPNYGQNPMMNYPRPRSPERPFVTRTRSRSPARFHAGPQRGYEDYDPTVPTASSPPRIQRWARSPSPIMNIAQRWNQEMNSVVQDNRGSNREDYGTAFERLAAQEARREEEALRQATRQRQEEPEIIALSDSDDEASDPRRPQRSRIPSPPKLSQYSSGALQSAYDKQQRQHQGNDPFTGFPVPRESRRSPPAFNPMMMPRSGFSGNHPPPPPQQQQHSSWNNYAPY